MTHTPGPWRMCAMTETDRGRMWGINGDEGTSGLSGDARLAEVFSIEANAKLVAAAPELLAALKRIDEIAGFRGFVDIDDICLAAIAHATK